MTVSLRSLIGKLNSSARNALEAAAGLCVSRTHYDVEIEHYLMKLLDTSGADFDRIEQRFRIDRARLSGELTRSLDALKSGNARTPAFSPSLAKMLEEAWKLGSLEYGLEEIRTGATILALVGDPELARMMREMCRELQKIDARVLQAEFLSILSGSREDGETRPTVASGVAPIRLPGKTPNLDQYTIDLTENARSGKIDPVLGRDREIRQVVDILMRRRQNNPILTGEAGVGKTA
ncbi:MAG: type VI secretion system ATPase TssH, partial [Bryobacteraceae bacterium]